MVNALNTYNCVHLESFPAKIKISEGLHMVNTIFWVLGSKYFVLVDVQEKESQNITNTPYYQHFSTSHLLSFITYGE